MGKTGEGPLFNLDWSIHLSCALLDNPPTHLLQLFCFILQLFADVIFGKVEVGINSGGFVGSGLRNVGVLIQVEHANQERDGFEFLWVLRVEC